MLDSAVSAYASHTRTAPGVMLRAPKTVTAVRPTSVHDGAKSLEDVLENACRLWGFDSEAEAIVKTKQRPVTNWEEQPSPSASASASAPLPAQQQQQQQQQTGAALEKSQRRTTKLSWSTTVDEAIARRPVRAAHIMDPVLQRLRNSAISAVAVADCIALHGLFLVIAPGSGSLKYPHLIHTIGLAGHGIPELFIRCPEEVVKACAYKMNSLARELIERNVILPHGTKVRPAGGGTTSTKTVGGRSSKRDGSGGGNSDSDEDNNDEQENVATSHVDGNWWVRELNTTELNDINNGLLIQAAKYYDRAVAVSEVLPEPGWRKYLAALNEGGAGEAEEGYVADGRSKIAAAGTARGAETTAARTGAVSPPPPPSTGDAAVRSGSNTSCSSYSADEYDGGDGASVDSDASLDVDDAMAEHNVPESRRSASPTASSRAASTTPKTCRVCSAPSNTRLCSTCSRVGTRSDVYKGHRKAAHAHASASPPARRRRASMENDVDSSVHSTRMSSV